MGFVDASPHNFAGTDEPHKFKGLLRLKFDRVDLIGVDQKVFVFARPVALDNVLASTGPMPGLFIADLLARGLMDLPARNFAPLLVSEHSSTGI